MELHEHVPIAECTSFKVGGTARYLASLASHEDVEELAQFVKERQLPYFILGGGSNVLIEDGEYPGVICRMVMRGIEWKDEPGHFVASVTAGESWDNFVEQCVLRGAWGIENLSGIPGTVGAAPIQNIGAYGCEVSECISTVELFNIATQKSEIFSQKQCNFSYRNSIFKTHPEYLVLKVQFRLAKQPHPNITYQDLKYWFCERNQMTPGIKEIRNAVLTIRSKKFPDLRAIGTAGSFFKNPIIQPNMAECLVREYPECPMYPQENGSIKISAAWLIDHVANMRGVRDGDVGSWSAQALVLVNYGKATEKEVSAFAEKIVEVVRTKTEITLEREVISPRTAN